MTISNATIQSLWIGPRLSLLEILSLKSFLFYGHAVHLYTYGHVENIPAGVSVLDASEILSKQSIFQYRRGEERGSYSGFANLFRLKLLIEKGGYWSDLDMICLKPLDFQEEYVFSSELAFDFTVKIHNGIIKAPASSDCIKYCLQQAERMKTKKLSHGENGAVVIADGIKKFHLSAYVKPHSTFCPIHYWETARFFDNMTANDFVGTYAIHFWNEMWRRGIQKKDLNPVQKTCLMLDRILKLPFKRQMGIFHDKNMRYRTNTLYGHLQERYL